MKLRASRLRMNFDASISNLLAWSGIGCWVVCFWWMHRISARQDALLKELQEQNREMHQQNARIEYLSKVEHDLIKEVHPAVSEIKASVEHVADEVAEAVSAGGPLARNTAA